MKKCFLLLILAVLLPMMVWADAVEIDGIYYELVSKAKEAEVTSNPNKYIGSVVIPEKVSYEGVEYRVTSIGYQAFFDCSILTSLTIPNSVTSIGNYAFYYCKGLTSVTIPNSVTSIGGFAFGSCSNLTSVNIGNSVTTIGGGAFCGCNSLSSVSIPNSVTYIGSSAFEDCGSLTTIAIPSSVTYIGGSAFKQCSSLTSVNIPNCVEYIYDYTFEGCISLSSVCIPNSVTSIGSSAFKQCSGLISVTIPNSVMSIDYWAFSGCSSLTSVTIPNSVKTIYGYAFSECSSLKSVTIGKGIGTIGSDAFARCKELTDVYCYAENVPSTQTDAFKDSYIEYATLHVPAASVETYKAAVPWKNFKEVVSLSGDTPEPPVTPQCATPTISYQNGELSFGCATEGVEFISEITDTDIKKYYTNKVQLTATYHISVYATKTGYDNSDVATATLCWIDKEPVIDVTAISQVPAQAVLIQSEGGVLTVQGLDDGQQVRVYGIDGTEAGAAVSSNGQATVGTSLPAGSVAIIKIGDRSVKVVVK